MNRRTASLSAKVLIRDGEGRILLLQRSRLARGNPGKWDLPGGKIDPNEDFLEGLQREVAEETGLAISIEDAPSSDLRKLTDRKVVYLFLTARLRDEAASGEIKLSGEHEAFAWVGREKIAEMDVCPQFVPFLMDELRSRRS